MSSKPERQDVYERVTARIVAAIEAGAGTFEMPWHHDGSDGTVPLNAASRRPYRGINVVALWAAAQALGYPTGLYATYRQWAGLGAQVRQGERGHLVVFWKVYGDEGREESEDGADPGEHAGRRFFARGFTVFNAAQVDGYTPPAAAPRRPEPERIAHADAFYAALDITTHHGGNRAYYRPGTDTIQLPPFAAFRDAVAYYATALHEAGHATAAAHRLGRDLSGRFGSESYAAEELVAELTASFVCAAHRLGRDLSGRFGSESYAAEELVAELTASFVCADLGLAVEPRPDHAAYIASWLKVLKGDKRAIFTAAGKAQAAADWMHARQPATGQDRHAA